jgi:hypothetical protein
MAVVRPVVGYHAAEHRARLTGEGFPVGALIMLGTLFGLIVVIFALVIRFDPEARSRSKGRGAANV